MDRFGVTKDGFSRKTYNDILEDLQSKAKEVFGENINLSNTSFLGLQLQNEAWVMSEIWELAEDIYFSSFVDSSEGISLDNTGKYITITRKPAQKSEGIITILGSEGTKIPKGFRVATKDLEKIYETTTEAILDDEGVAHIGIISIEPGLEMNVPSKTILEVVNPIGGVDEIYNVDPTEGGLDIEDDKDFRDRYYRSPSRGGSSTRESVEAAILDMEEVTDAFVEENTSMEYMGEIPPKSLAPYVFGGEDMDIAKVILVSKAGGIRSCGDIEVILEDSKGREHTIGFTRPEVKDIYVNINLEKDKGYPGDSIVSRAVINYIGGMDVDGITYKGLKLNENVVISKIMSSVMCLKGVKDIEVEIGLDGESYKTANISIDKGEIAKTSFEKVVINHV